MAKKSAKSKGFRKHVGKKPYLSKRDIVLLCLLAAALAVACFFLFRYDDGALKVVNGAVQAEGDNWLIVNGSNTRGGTRYFKLGEIGELERYARAAEAVLGDDNLTSYVFTAEGADISPITVSTSHAGAETLAKYAAASLGAVESAEIGEVQSAELGGVNARYFFYVTAPAEATEDAETPAESAEEDEEDAPAHAKTLSGYIDAGHDSCVVFRLESAADTAEALPADDAMLAALEEAIRAVTLEAAK